MAGSQKVFLRIVALTGDGPDTDEMPDRVSVNGRGRLVPTLATGSGDVAQGPDSLHEIRLVEPVPFEIINGMLTYDSKPYVWLAVPTGEWNWRITFDVVSIGESLRELRDFTFPLSAATPSQVADPAYPGINLAQYGIAAWEPGTVNLTAQAIQQITIYLGRASNSAIAAGEHADRAESTIQYLDSQAERAETAASGAETARTGAETARTGAEAAKTAAETAKSAAESARTAAGTARTGAEAARTGAETARTGAEAARAGISEALNEAQSSADDAETSRAAAQAARTGAETARTQANTARDTAQGHATTASQQATAAAGSATQAGSARDAAVTARTGAESARGTASSHATAAGTARSEAEAARDAAAGHAGDASGHASAAAGSASAASGSATVASQKAAAADGSATDAADALAQVLVELANTQAYQDVISAIGDMSSSWNADIQSAISALVDQAPETLDTLAKVAQALGNDPNFATTVMAAIGERVKSTDPRLSDARPPTAHTHTIAQVTGLAGALDSKSDAGHSHTWAQVTGKPGTFASTIALVAGLQAALDGKAATGHTHTKAQVGLGSVDNTSDAAKPISTATQAALTPLQGRVAATPATWRWNGTSLPTAASQVHAQARVGDFIVCPNLTADPGWHQITGV